MISAIILRASTTAEKRETWSNLKMAPDIKENGFSGQQSEKARAFKYGQMVHFMRVGGKTTRQTVRVD